MLPFLPNWAPLLYAAPNRYIDTDYDWPDFDLEHWSTETFTWESDGWMGLRDTVQPPTQTIETGCGDCDDYALVALSYLAYWDVSCNLAFLYNVGWPPGGHVIAYTQTKTYSSGVIRRERAQDFKARSDYNVMLTRSVR